MIFMSLLLLDMSLEMRPILPFQQCSQYKIATLVAK